MSKIIMQTWSSFIKSGVPDVPGVTWNQVTPESREYLVLDISSRMERSEDYDTKMKFWKELFPC